LQEKKKTDQIMEKVQKQLKECEKAKQEYLEGWKRTKADFINYKHREGKIIDEHVAQSIKSLLLKLLFMADDFQRLEKAFEDKNASIENLQGASSQIKNQINQFLAENKIIKIETKNQEFDPRFHEAVECVKSSQPKNTIIKEIMTGYLIDGKLLRPAKVKLAK